MTTILAVFCLQASNLPPEIQSVKEERIKYETAYVDWTVAHADYLERFELRAAADTMWQRNLGDQDGFHPKKYEQILEYLDRNAKWKQTEEMHASAYEEPQHRLLYEGRVWEKAGSAHWASIYERDPQRSLGFEDWGIHSHPDPYPIIEMHGCSSTLDGARHVVSCRIQVGKTLEWVLDPEKGSQPIRTMLRGSDSNPIAWSETELVSVDGRWMPSSVEFFRAGEEEPYETLTVQEASFDRDWHRREPYDPNDLGIGLGHLIGNKGNPYWDGASLIDREEFLKLRYLYDVPLHPDVIEKSASFQKMSVKSYLARNVARGKKYKLNHAAEYAELLKERAAGEKDGWDAYTEKFIEEHKLSKPKKALAERILSAAKKLRDVYRDKQTVSSEKERYDAIEKRIFDRLLVHNLKRLK